MRDWFGRMIVGGTVFVIVGGLWTYASLQKVISSEKRVYYPAVREPLPPPPPEPDIQISRATE